MSLLHQLERQRLLLWRSTNRFSERETARVVEVSDTSFVIETQGLRLRRETQVLLNFEIRGQPYFLSAPPLDASEANRIRLSLPGVIYQAERRDRARSRATARPVQLETPALTLADAQVADVSADGLAVDVPGDVDIREGTWVRVHPPHESASDPSALREGFAQVRNVRPAEREGWRRIGLSLTLERPAEAVSIEPADFRQSRRVAEVPLDRPPLLGSHVPLVRFMNQKGEHLTAIVDSCGDPRGATAVVIPPAWGRTKETLLPLAATILETFRSIDEPVVVVRLDGIRKRGESYLDPECRVSNLENLHFTFSQGAADIAATVDFLHGAQHFKPSKIILITFSVSSIEGRRAMANAKDTIGGWISVVGSADAQSLTRVISGGVDFFGGAERGVRFGYQEIQGMLVDMDRAAADALTNRLAFLDDSRRDFMQIRAPITWIHGHYDAWMDLERIKHVLQFGNTTNRQILIVPTGHQLRTSEEAMATFELIASEVGQMALGRSIPPHRPEPFDLAERAQAERLRLDRPPVDLRKFWRDYLVGRTTGAGIALVAGTTPYRSLMQSQVDALEIESNQSIADLGCGIATFVSHLLEAKDTPRDIRVVSVDYVIEALASGRSRCLRLPMSSEASPSLAWIQASLDVASAAAVLPIRSNSQDSVLLSLVINYVPSPGALLREIHRILKPDGRLVLSSLKRDADISGICVDAVAELRQGRGREILGAEGERHLGDALQSFISDASKLLDLEEAGLFHFWNEAELLAMMEAAGFTVAKQSRGLGSVPQAHLVVANKPRPQEKHVVRSDTSSRPGHSFPH